MTQIFAISESIAHEILKEVGLNLAKLDNTYTPSVKDRSIFIPYGKAKISMSFSVYSHPQFLFEVGREINELVISHQLRIGKEICKEALYAIMSVCAIDKNDLLNYRIYMEKMMDQIALYDPTNVPLIDLIISNPVFGSLKRETERVTNENTFVKKLQAGFFPNLDFVTICKTLSSFHQRKFVSSISEYRMLHFNLSKTDCPAIVFEHSYSLIQDLCVLVESHLKEKKSSTNLLASLLNSDIDNPYRDILNSRLHLFAAYPTNSVTTFNTNFPIILQALDDATDPEEIICYCLYITYMCRNQVLHNLTEALTFYGDGPLTEKLIGIIIAAIYFVSKI